MTISEAIMVEVQRLAEPEQRTVLQFARAMTPVVSPPASGRTLADLRPFVGPFDAADLADIQAAIREGCERVDADTW